MEARRLLQEQRGVTLMEVTMALAIFTVVIGVTAQTLMSFYVSIDMQEQRMEAIAASRSVMDSLREKRYEFREDFPEGLLAWIDDQNGAAWEQYHVDDIELNEQAIAVVCENEAANAAGPGDNPIVVHVTTTWLDGNGRPLSATVSSILTDE